MTEKDYRYQLLDCLMYARFYERFDWQVVISDIIERDEARRQLSPFYCPF